jgi:hypothetical protein
MIGPDEMPALACDVLEAGLDGPSIRRVAALVLPSGWETDQIMPAFKAEAGLRSVSVREASTRLARQLALRILSEELDPLIYTRDFESLWIRADYPTEMQELGSLDDQKSVAEYIGQTEAELRGNALGVLRTFAAANEPESSNC